MKENEELAEESACLADIVRMSLIPACQPSALKVDHTLYSVSNCLLLFVLPARFFTESTRRHDFETTAAVFYI